MGSALGFAGEMTFEHGIEGVGGIALDTVVGGGASVAIGYVHHKFNDKWYGKHAAWLAAAVGKVAAVGLQLALGPGPHWSSAIANSVGQAGVNAKGTEWGIKMALKGSGKKAILVPADADITKIPGAVAVGALPKAEKGRGLSFDTIEEMSDCV